MAKLGNVVDLNLRDTKITSAGLVHLKGLAKLTRLHLERTNVGDEGIANLTKLTTLEYLNLYGTKITDKSLDHLAGLKNLRQLYVWQTDVTDAGIAKFKKALPAVSVVKGIDLSTIIPVAKEDPSRRTISSGCRREATRNRRPSQSPVSSSLSASSTNATSL